MRQQGNNANNFSQLDYSDVIGTKTNTRIRGISTKRITNPLNPVYNWLTTEPSVSQNPLRINK